VELTLVEHRRVAVPLVELTFLELAVMVLRGVAVPLVELTVLEFTVLEFPLVEC
jgi:hypothetical protein